jgi:hypothetical protein
MDTMVDYEEDVDLWASVWKEIISSKGNSGYGCLQLVSTRELILHAF